MNTTKKCNDRNKYKHISEYTKNTSKQDNLSLYCKECNKIRCLNYSHTIDGLIAKIYLGQKGRSLKKWNTTVKYSKNELKEWLLKQSMFNILFVNWEKSNYNKMKVPSVDRINDNIGYEINNIQLMTWGENKAKGHRDIRSSKLIHGNKPQRPVIQYGLCGALISEYVSINEAMRLTGTISKNIIKVCRGKRKTAGGFKWKYKKEATYKPHK